MTMVIRPAAGIDASQIVALGARFLREVYADRLAPADPAQLLATATWMLNGEDRAVFVADRGDGQLTGMIGVFLHPHPFTGERTASEMFWWVDPETRGEGMRLLRAAEAWARRAGAVVLQMGAPDARVGQFYERLGFTKLETSYARRLV